jgi:ribosomal protein S18 acetylase RimI-like enzyme
MTPTPGDHWVVEWVATLPEYRGRGLVAGLLQEMLERGRGLDYEAAQISIMIGNDAAQRAYESAGFAVVDEKTSPQLDALLGTPGFRRLRRAI